MRKLLLLAGAGMMAALGTSATAAVDAKPGKGQGKPNVVKVAPWQVKAKSPKRIWTSACPPGLAWRGTVCVPPGHGKRLLAVGTRVPNGWSYTPWGAVPTNLRNTYALDPAYRYIYRDNVIYVVDPQTRLITSVIDAIL